jgi:hypothetical protein
MAKVLITKQVLETLSAELAEYSRQLKDCAEAIDTVFPEEKGISLLQAPPVNDAFPAVAEFTAEVLAEVKAARFSDVPPVLWADARESQGVSVVWQPIRLLTSAGED